MFKEALAKLKLPKGFKVQIDPWPYGGPDPDEQALRCELWNERISMQILN